MIEIMADGEIFREARDAADPPPVRGFFTPQFGMAAMIGLTSASEKPAAAEKITVPMTRPG